MCTPWLSHCDVNKQLCFEQMPAVHITRQHTCLITRDAPIIGQQSVSAVLPRISIGQLVRWYRLLFTQLVSTSFYFYYQK